MKIINPGEFRHRIEIQEYKPYKDNEDIYREGWIPIFKCKAKVINISGKEIAMAGGENSIISKRFILRYPKSIEVTDQYRVIYKEKEYNIKYSNNIEDRNIYLELVAELVG